MTQEEEKVWIRDLHGTIDRNNADANSMIICTLLDLYDREVRQVAVERGKTYRLERLIARYREVIEPVKEFEE